MGSGAAQRARLPCQAPGGTPYDSPRFDLDSFPRSWATFYTDVELPAATVEMHAPILDTRMVPLTDIVIAFCPGRASGGGGGGGHRPLALLALTRSLREEHLAALQ